MSIWLIYSTSVLQTSFTENATFMQYVVFSHEWEVGFVCLEGYKCVHKISDLWTLCYRETQAELIPQNTAVNTLPTGKHSLNRRPIYFESMSKFMHISFILNNIWNIFFFFRFNWNQNLFYSSSLSYYLFCVLFKNVWTLARLLHALFLRKLIRQ